MVGDMLEPEELLEPIEPEDEPEESVEPEPVEPEPIDPEPDEPEPVEPDPVEPEPIEPDEPVEPLDPVELPVPVEPLPLDDEPEEPLDGDGAGTTVVSSTFLVQAPNANSAANANEAVVTVFNFDVNMEVSFKKSRPQGQS